MKKTLKRMLPPQMYSWAYSVRTSFRILDEFGRDRRRYWRHAHPFPRTGDKVPRAWLEAQITKDYHSIEKGLSLAEPKRPFGTAVAQRLEWLLPLAEAVEPDAPYIVYGRKALRALREWNATGAIDASVAPLTDAASDRMGSPVDASAGDFFRSRHSVRNFSPEPVDRKILDDAVSLAAQSPSVCNRQPWAIRLFDGVDVQRMLVYQNGNRGFGSSIPTLALITVDLGMFTGLIERNQAWIEGGIFASTFVWALHSAGLSSCMLNLSLENRRADELRAEAGMSAAEVPIVMVAIGWAADEHRVARSARRSLEKLVVS
jgi:hypothetical protein